MKLGQIQYRQVSLGRPAGPELAAQEYNAKRTVLGAVQKLGRDVAEMGTEYQIIEANAEHRDRIAGVQQVIASNPTLPQAQLEEWGILEEVRAAAPDGKLDNDVPQHLWAAIAMRDALAQSSEMAGEKITLPGMRRRYLAGLDEVNDRQVGMMLEASARQAVEFQRDQAQAMYELGLETGNFTQAREAVQGGAFASNPALQSAMLAQIDQEEELAGYDQMRLDGQYTEAMAQLRDNERETALSSAQRSDLYFDLANEQVRMQSTQLQAAKIQQDLNFVDLYARLDDRENPVSRQELYNLAQNRQISKSDYVSLMDALNNPDRDGSITKQVEDTLYSAIVMAQFGDYAGVPDLNRDGKVTTEDAQAYYLAEIRRNATMENADGTYTRTLTPDAMRDLRVQVEGITDVVYDDSRFDRLKERIALLVGRGTIVDGRTVGVDKEGALAMARALRQLDADIREEGAAFDYQQWEAEKLPRFMTDRTEAALLGLSVDASRKVVKGPDGSIDFTATKEKIKADIKEAARTRSETKYLEKLLDEVDQVATEAGY
jgi:hypothetical protein